MGYPDLEICCLCVFRVFLTTTFGPTTRPVNLRHQPSTQGWKCGRQVRLGSLNGGHRECLRYCNQHFAQEFALKQYAVQPIVGMFVRQSL